MCVQWTLSGRNSLISLLYFLSIIAISSINGCTFGEDGAMDVSAYTTADREPKFSTLETPYGEFQPLMVIYTSNTGKSYIWFTLSPLGIYSSNDRAIIIANRLEAYRQQKMIEVAWGTLNSQSIICARTQEKPNDCQTIVTLPPDIEPKQVLYLLRCKLETPDDPACVSPIRS